VAGGRIELNKRTIVLENFGADGVPRNRVRSRLRLHQRYGCHTPRQNDRSLHH
jgi:hypothetical protein